VARGAGIIPPSRLNDARRVIGSLIAAIEEADDRRMTPHHRPAPLVALVAGVSLSLWLVVSAGVRTATTHPIQLSEPPTNAATLTSEASPMPSPGPALMIEVR
jgi:hypothetical protein